jgi:hypothetical protein
MPDSRCWRDCAGEWLGDAVIDDCGKCVTNERDFNEGVYVCARVYICVSVCMCVPVSACASVISLNFVGHTHTHTHVHTHAHIHTQIWIALARASVCSQKTRPMTTSVCVRTTQTWAMEMPIRRTYTYVYSVYAVCVYV